MILIASRVTEETGKIFSFFGDLCQFPRGTRTGQNRSSSLYKTVLAKVGRGVPPSRGQPGTVRPTDWRFLRPSGIHVLPQSLDLAAQHLRVLPAVRESR